jgi:cysteine synthase
MRIPDVLSAIGHTPLVRLHALDEGLPNAVYGKCEHLNPSGSIKDRIALAIVEAHEASGALKPGGTLIEATAGNTGMGLAMVAAVKGYRLICVMPAKMSVDKRNALRMAGAEVVVTDNAPPNDPRNFQNVARRLAEERGAVLADQFEHPANIAAHERGTGPEILADLPDVGAFVAGAGTGGTLTGVGRALRAAGSHAQVWLADPVGSLLAGTLEGRDDPDQAYAVEGIGSSKVPGNLDLSLLAGAIRVSDDESFATAHRLIREQGLFVGGSAGTNVAAALRVAALPSTQGPVVTVLCDSWDRYFSTPWLLSADR